MSTETPRKRIQILVGTETDKAALRELLAETYEIVTDETLQNDECYLVDDQCLPVYREAFLEQKTQVHPTFCPVVLIHREDTRIDIDLSGTETNSKIARLVDDVVDAPVDRAKLLRRIDNLLVRREQSRKLTREYERVEQWFEGLFSALPDPAFVLNMDGRIQAVNEAFCTLVDEERTALLGTTIAGIPTFGIAFENLQTLIEPADSEQRVPTNEVVEWKRESSHDTRYGQLSVQTAEVAGEPYIVGVLSDITELKQKTDRLEELASVLSHDLRNPIQVAELQLRTLRESAPHSRKEVEAIARSITRIHDLTEKLVTIAQTGEEGLERDTIEMGACVHRAWNGVATDTVELLIEGDETKQCIADQVRFEQLLQNLFRNAIDHGGEGVTVWFGWTEDGFYVEDNGPGVPENDREEIFEMGYSNHPGGGLGLAIVTEIANAHGWDVAVTDGREGGARFEVTGVKFSSDWK